MRWFDIAEELLPPVYKAIKDMYAYAKSLNTEFLNWVSYLERILNNFFIQRCSLQTLEYWEDLLDIPLNGDETIEERRIKVLEYLNNIYPTSEPYVRSVIERMFPEEEYHLWFDVENNNPFDLNIDIFTTNITELNKFKEWMRKMCPAHLLQIIAKAERVEIERPFIVNNGILGAAIADIGLVKFIVPPYSNLSGGLMTVNESIEIKMNDFSGVVTGHGYAYHDSALLNNISNIGGLANEDI